MLSAVVRAVSEHIVDSKPKAALAIFKNMALVNRFSTTLLFLNDEETRLLRKAFDTLGKSGYAPNTVRKVRQKYLK